MPHIILYILLYYSPTYLQYLYYYNKHYYEI